MDCIPPIRNAGRRERRRLAMIEAARSLFLEKGYDAVTLGDIVRRSGGSLSTMYDLFENKAGLLNAIVAEERFEGQERLDAIVARGGSPAAILRAIAAQIQQDLTQPDVTGLMRIVMAESLRNAVFAQMIYDNAHRPRVEWLAGLFGGWTARGHAQIVNPEMAAHSFLGLIVHAAQTRALLGDPGGLCADTNAQCVEEGVKLCVLGYAITTDPATDTP